MKIKLTTANRLLGASAVAVACVVAAGAMGYWLFLRIAHSGAETAHAATAIRLQMQADQSHDALRSDVLAALVAGPKKDAAAQKEVKEDLAKHAAQLRDAMQALRSMRMGDQADEALARVRPLVEGYLASADATAAAAFSDQPAEQALAAFTASFKAVESQMAALSALIDQRAQRTDEESQATSQLARQLIVVGTVGAAVLIFALGILNWRHITRQLGGEPDDVAQAAAAIAAGDLSTRLDVSRAAPGSIVDAVNSMQESLRRLVGTVRGSSETIAIGSKEIATGNADLSQRTEAQASNLQQTAASMEQLGATVKNNADAARQAAQLATAACSVAVSGGEAMGKVVSTMQAISASSQKIVDIIGVIDGIAFQTNILALNAAVEAARAGEQGRGFAVVASEVRSLAQRSSAAAKEIKDLIDASVADVDAGSRQVGDAGDTMNDIVARVRSVNDLIAEISAATLEQTAGIGQVSVAVTQLDQTTQRNATLVEQSAAAAENLSQQAALLVETVRVFKLQ